MKKEPNLKNIKLLALDVDGVLTDGTIIIGPDGRDSKPFNSLDGHGIRMWKRAGLEAALVTGRSSEAVSFRAKELGVEHVFQDCHHKLPVVESLLERLGLSPDNLAYMGDDLTDLPCMRYAGFASAVANAVEEVKSCADYVTAAGGGKGAVREVIEHILKNTGKWQELIERYLK
jgi:3-deoxy-D-manno-octulosonate 8-phosphate phosphatase (KDO 8-P phosphatase)